MNTGYLEFNTYTLPTCWLKDASAEAAAGGCVSYISQSMDSTFWCKTTVFFSQKLSALIFHTVQPFAEQTWNDQFWILFLS